MPCKLDGILAPAPPVLPSASPGRFTEGKEAVTELQDPAGISQMQPRRTPSQQQGPGQFPQPASGATSTAQPGARRSSLACRYPHLHHHSSHQ